MDALLVAHICNFGKLRQDGYYKLKTSLSYLVRHCLKQKSEINTK